MSYSYNRRCLVWQVRVATVELMSAKDAEDYPRIRWPVPSHKDIILCWSLTCDVLKQIYTGGMGCRRRVIFTVERKLIYLCASQPSFAPQPWWHRSILQAPRMPR